MRGVLTCTLLGLAGCHLIFQYQQVAVDAKGPITETGTVDAGQDRHDLGPVPDAADAPPDLGLPDHPDAHLPDTQLPDQAIADTEPPKSDLGPSDAKPAPCSQWSHWNVLNCDPATCKAVCFPLGYDPVELNCASATSCKCTNLNTGGSVSCSVPSANACIACQNAVLDDCCLPLL